ncbi:MAG: glycosyltransferase [Candidatus Omnitrophota bacterium]
MKILITYASAGAGHFKAAQAVYQHLKKNGPTNELAFVDALKMTDGVFRFFYKRSYSFLIRHTLFVWHLLFCLTDFKPASCLIRSVGFIINYCYSRRFIRFLLKEQFDCIFSTHFFPAEIAAHLKKKKKIKSRLVTLITDFGVHGYWVSEGTDHYLVAAEATKRKLIKKGVIPDLITISGIPVDRSFLEPCDKTLLHEKFHTDKNRFTVLIAAGSFGIGPIEALVDLLDKEVQILVVCAENRRLYDSLKQKGYRLVHVFGFVNYMAELMSLSQLIVTKAGGMTIAESLSKGLVPIFMMAIPGQERENVQVLSHYGIGSYTRNIARLREVIMDFKEHPQKLDAIKANFDRIKKPHALEEISRVICPGRAGYTC